MTRQKALALRALLVTAADSLSDKDISQCPEFAHKMAYDGSLIEYQTRINWRGTVKMAAQDLWDREENDPDHAPALWDDIDYIDGIRKIKENMSAGEAFSEGEKGWWKGEVYESTYNGNVYTPEQYPDGWRKCDGM